MLLKHLTFSNSFQCLITIDNRSNPDWVFRTIDFLELKLVAICATVLITIKMLINDQLLIFNCTIRASFRNKRNTFKGVIIEMEYSFYAIITMVRIKNSYFCEIFSLRFLGMSYATGFSASE